MVHNIRLFASTTEDFSTNGLGTLTEAIKCEVKEEANGAFELELEYPVWGKRYNDLIQRNFIVCKSNPFSTPQIFRIYSISRPMDGIVTYNAQHISYDLTCHPLLPFKATSCAEAMSKLKTNSLTKHNFTFWTDKNTVADFGFDVPVSIRSALGGIEGSILDTYRGDYEFDNFTVKLHNNRGVDRGFTVRYGKNLTDFSQEETIDNVYTSVYPYWMGQDEAGNEIYTELADRLVPVDTPYNFTNVLILDLSSEFNAEPSEEQMRAYTESYIENNNVGVPSINFDISFVQLSQSLEYEDRKLLDQIELFDTVTVEFDMLLGKKAKAKVVKTTYDAIADRYETITLGTVKVSITDTVGSIGRSIESSEKKSNNRMDQAVANATWWITNGKGYMVAVKDEAGNWKELCSLDKPSINDAVNVWRWNNGGFGHSSHGYNGPYDLAITQDGHIVADFIDTGTLTATLITAGILQDKVGDTFYLDLDSGTLNINATSLSITGKAVGDMISESVTTGVSSANDFTRTSVADSLDNSKKYTDAGVADAKKYTDDGVAGAKDYTDGEVSLAKQYAQEYSDQILEKYGLEVTQEIADALGNALVQKNIFDILTNNGEIEGLFMKDGKLYINAEYIATGILQSKDGKTFFLDLDNGILNLNANLLSISGTSVPDSIEAAKNASIQYTDTSVSDMMDATTKYTDTSVKDTLDSSKKYTDTGVSGAKKYTDDEVAEAKSYTDGEITLAKQYAQEYSDEILERYGIEVTQEIADALGEALVQKNIFDALTDHGKLQGLFMKDGKLYINAAYVASGILQSKDGTTFFLDLDNGILRMDANLLSISGTSVPDSITKATTDAKKYTDDGVAGAKGYTDTAAANAKEYTDTGVAGAKKYTDDEVAGAKEYTDTAVKENLTEAQQYAQGILEEYGLEADKTLRDSIAAATTQKAIFDSLTNKGLIKGIIMENNELYINATYVSTGILQSRDGETFYLDLEKGVLRMQADTFSVSGKTIDSIADTKAKNAVDAQTQRSIYDKLTNNGATPGLTLNGSQLYLNATYMTTGILQSKDEDTFFLDLDRGILKMHASELTIDGNNVNNALANTVVSLVQEFYSSSSPTQLSGGNWSTSQPTWTQGKYIWNRQHVTYGNGNSAYLPSTKGVCITGNTGANGTNGTNGTNGKDGANGKDGKNGTNGTNGISITGVTAQYYQNTSSTTAPSSSVSWSTTIPDAKDNQYIWCRQHITYSNGTSTYTTPYCMTKIMGDIAQQKVNSQTPEDVFNRLTNNGQMQGLYIENGNFYFNASYIKTGTLSADRIKGGTLILGGSASGVGGNGSISIRNSNGTEIGYWNNSGFKATTGKIGPWTIMDTAIYNGIAFDGNKNSKSTGIGTYGSNWAFWAGNGRFTVDQDGNFSAQNGIFGGSLNGATGTFSGDISAASGTFKGKIQSSGSYANATIEDGYMDFGNLIQIGVVGDIISGYIYEPDPLGDPSIARLLYSAPMLRYKQVNDSLIVVGNSMYVEFKTGYNITFYTNLEVRGNLAVKGTKPRVVTTNNYEDRLLYCYETPSPLFGDIGEGSTDESGDCYIFLDDVFTETVTTEIEYQVFLQKEGPGDIWISEKTPKYFVVSGTPNLKFAWEIKAKQRDYEYDRMEKYYTDPPDETDYEQEYIDEYDSLIKEMEELLK